MISGLLSVLFAFGGAPCCDEHPFRDPVQGLGSELDPWAAAMICDGNVVADIDVADEKASPGQRMQSKRKGLCARNLSARARGLLHCFSRDVCVCCNRVRGGTIRRAARIKIPIPSFA